MLLSVLLQATAAAVGVSKLGAAIGAGLAVIRPKSKPRLVIKVISRVGLLATP